MNSKSHPPLRLFLLCMLTLCCTACAWLRPLEAPTVDVSNMMLLPPNGVEQRVRLNLRVQNPNDRTLKLKGLKFALRLNDNDVLSGLSNQHTVLPALGEASLQVDVGLSVFGGLGLLRELVRHPDAPLNYALTGKLYLDEPLMPDLPIKREGSLPLSRP